MKKYLIILTVLTFNLVVASEDRIDIAPLRVALTGFIRTSTVISDAKVEEFIAEKSISDAPRFKKHIVTILPKMIEEKTIIAEDVVKRIEQAQTEGEFQADPVRYVPIDVKANLKELSVLNPEGDAGWFDPTKSQFKFHKPSPQHQMLFDFCAYHFFAPVKLLKLQAIQKIATTGEVLSTAYLLYQAE